jgi:phytol kinase
MLYVLTTLVGIFFLLIMSNALWRVDDTKPEVSRKFVHIAVGIMIAFWPFFISFEAIRWLSLLMFAVVLASKHFNIFPSIHAVNRYTWGEIFFPLGVGLVTVLTDSPVIFAAAILHMSIADGMAAVVGVTIGYKSSYTVFGHQKSLAGTLAFIVCSFGILYGMISQGAIAVNDLTIPLIFAMPLLGAIAENMSPYGLDNVTVPLVVIYFLSYIQLLS